MEYGEAAFDHDEDIRKLGLRRVQLRHQLARVEADLGPLLRAAHEAGRSLSGLGREIGASHPYVAHLIDTAPDEAPVRDWTVPAVPARELPALMGDRRPRRIIAAFEESDVLHHSRLHPSLFVSEFDSLNIPNMLVELDVDSEERWIGVSDVTVGYGGTGPSNAARLLKALGFPAPVSESMYRFRFLELDCGSVEFVEADEEWPRYPIDAPAAHGDAFVFDLDRRWDPTSIWGRGRRAPQKTWYRPGFDARPDGTMTIDSLLTWLRAGPGERVEWAGRWEERVARVYLDGDSARAHGFVHRPWSPGRSSHGRPCQLILEQGDVQLWLPVMWPTDKTRYLTDETYKALGMFELIPEELSSQDGRAKAWRWLKTRWEGERRPGWIDISPGEDRRSLKHSPL